MTNIDALSAASYARGEDPIDVAIQIAEIQIYVLGEVERGRSENPASFPGFVGDTTSRALAGRIIGHLLDAGWTPPSTDHIAALRRQIKSEEN